MTEHDESGKSSVDPETWHSKAEADFAKTPSPFTPQHPYYRRKYGEPTEPEPSTPKGRGKRDKRGG